MLTYHALCQDSGASRTAVLEAKRRYEKFRPDGEPTWLSLYTEAEQSVSLTELDEEITVFLRSAHNDKDLTT